MRELLGWCSVIILFWWRGGGKAKRLWMWKPKDSNIKYLLDTDSYLKSNVRQIHQLVDLFFLTPRKQGPYSQDQ